MREHGLIERLMIIYQECADRLSEGVDVPPGALLNAGVVVDGFVQNYHEGLEEKHIFPLFEKAGRLTNLVAILRRQHEVGRILSGRTIFYAGKGNLLQPDTKAALVPICQGYTRMYREHMGREDTMVFTAVRDLVSPAEFRRMGDLFEDLETQTLGQGGYERELGRVSEIEKMLGIEDLDKFTAKA
jgi:hemerythrin-like domain-containing protein